jgi:hypothetical protein
MGVEPADDWRRGDLVDTPPPTSPPTFELAPDVASGTPLWPVQEILDGAFFMIGTALVMWLGWIVVTVGFDGWFAIGSLFFYWVLLAYVGLGPAASGVRRGWSAAVSGRAATSSSSAGISRPCRR